MKDKKQSFEEMLADIPNQKEFEEGKKQRIEKINIQINLKKEEIRKKEKKKKK